jgi:hypothetical protein
MTTTAALIHVPRDAGELREELADIYTRDFLMPSMYRRACRIIRSLARSTGLSEEAVIQRDCLTNGGSVWSERRG